MSEQVEPIAVIGMACRLPGGRDVEEFWRNLVAGRESITFFEPAELRVAGVSEAELANPAYVRAAPMMPDVDRFDADLFGMTPAEARLCDPQIRVFLELCHAALEHAGYDPFDMRDDVGVFGSTGPNGYLRHVLTARPDLLADGDGLRVYTVNQPDYLATLVSYKLDLRGPSMTVLTACSSSLVTVHLGAQALRVGECDVVLAGGVSVEMPLGHGHLWTPGAVYSADGHCRPFAADATGTVFGSGGGVVVLKRLADAIAAGDDVRAVIRGSAINNDGSDKVSYSAPSASGQTAAVVEAMALAETTPDEVDYVEAHATGTALGDPVEVAALADAYAALAPGSVATATALGSVKSNVGHLGAAAGVVGLIKTVLMLERETIVPTIGITDTNPRLELAGTPFSVATELRAWLRTPPRTRVAAVSSFGIGGTNAHVVLSEGPAVPARPTVAEPQVVVWSARTEQACEHLRRDLVTHFGAHGEKDFADAAATLRHGRTAHPVRAAVVCDSAMDAVRALEDTARQLTGTARDDPRVAFLFPGQGAQHAGMAAGLYGRVRSFSIAMDECIELFEQRGVPLYEAWLAHERVDDTAVVQPLLFSVEYAMAAMWEEWGITPSALLGHSLGELTAAAVAGVFTLPDAVAVVAARAAAMAAHPVHGGMLALAADVATVADRLPAAVALAAVNGDEQTVLAGPGDVLDAVAATFAADGIGATRLGVSHAFHHPDWRRAADLFADAVAPVRVRPAGVPVFSAATGELLSAQDAVRPEFWAEQLVRPVRFWPALCAMLAQEDLITLEVGPGRALTGLARRHRAAAGRTVASLPLGTTASHDDLERVLGAAACLWVRGVAVDWETAGQHAPVRRVAVPGYPYQRERYWADPPAAPATEVPTSPFTTIEWTHEDRPATRPVTGETALVLLPDTEETPHPLLAVEQAGYRTVRVRPGDRYAEADGEFTVRPGEPGDLAAVLSALAGHDVWPRLFVHAAAATAFAPLTAAVLPGQLDTAVMSVLALARLAVSQPPGRSSPRFVVITTEAVDVSGAEVVAPAKAAVLGLVRSFLPEHPGLRGGVLDIGGDVRPEDVAAELTTPLPRPVLALRGRRRWVPVERPLDLAATGRRQALRENGVYLITGGFGGLGRAVARHLAASGLRPRLVLLGRHDPTAADAQVPAAADRIRTEILDLRALGAEVITVAVDITDLAALRAAVTAVTDRFGPVNGVLHLAGLPGGGMVAFREPAAAAAVLAPKVLGAVHLAEVLASAPALDFAVLFSSRAAADGLVGGADYAAANAFLDALAANTHLANAVSVAWPVWLGEGMVDHDGPELTELADAVARLDLGAPAAHVTTWEDRITPASHWVLDEHRVGRTALLPATAYVDLVVRVFRERLAGPDDAVELSDVVFRAPYTGEVARLLRIEFTPGTGRHDFVIASEVDGVRLVHVTGTVRSTRDPAPTTDLDGLRGRLVATGATPVGSGTPFTTSPRWRNITAVRQAGAEKLVDVALMAAFTDDLAEHPVHPALLDTVTAEIRGPGEGSFVPFLYRRVVVYGNLPARFAGHVRTAASGPDTSVGDIDLIAEDGTVLVRIEGFTMRRFEFTEGWAERTLPGPATVPVRREKDKGLDPTTGVRLLTELLASRPPAAVLVRPHVDGCPTPVGQDGRAGGAVESPGTDTGGAVTPPPAVATEARVSGSSPRDRLSELWAQVLGAEPADDLDFFDAGGDSLAAVELAARIRAAFGVELNIGLLLELRTFGELLDAVATSGL